MTDAIRLFAAIDENVRAGTVALRHTLLQAKGQAARSPVAMASGASASGQLVADMTARVAHLLLAAQYEARLAWLIWHPDSRLTSEQRTVVLRGGVAARWKSLLGLALSDRLARRDPPVIVDPEDVPRGLPRQDRERYTDLIRVAREHLDPLIDTRNSLAHGEWRIALARSTDGINESRTNQIEKISLFRVTIAANLLEHYWKCYFDALVTYQAFERDFPVHHRRMMHAATRLENADEDRWLANLRKRFVDGRASHGGLSEPPMPSQLCVLPRQPR